MNKYAIYLSFAAFHILFLFVTCHPYWLVYYTPFFAIIVFMNTNNIKNNLFLDIGMSLSTLISQIYYFYWCFSANQVNYMLMPHLFGFRTNATKTVVELIGVSTFEKYMPMVLALNFISVFFLLFINRPKKGEQTNIDDVAIERSIIWSRMLLIIPIAILMIVCYYF